MTSKAPKAFSTIQLVLTTMIWLVDISDSYTQNLAPNPDFENHSYCPAGYNIPGFPDIACIPWVSGGWGTPDYFNVCSTPSDVGVPDNDPGWQIPLSGDGYGGFLAKATSVTDYREYLQTTLLEPLIADKWYTVSFYVSLANDFCGVEKIGAYFSAEPPPYNSFDPILVTPQVESNGPFLADTANWMLIEGCFKANGGELVVTIGNFHPNVMTPIDPICTVYPLAAYYFVDDVFIGEVQPGGLDLELGDPLSDCSSVTIDPGINGVEYYWEDGSTGQTLTVTTSGTYSLTIYDGCNAGVDSVEVNILNVPPLQIFPEEVSICEGETFTYSLDPDLGQYTWEDGSHAFEYDITTTGFYTVSLDDGCDITSDVGHVIVVIPPPPFTLGGDTTICTGSHIEYDFDPGLGDFQWQDNNTSSFYTIDEEGYYAVTITNMCGEESAEVEVAEIAPETVSLGPSQATLCPGEVLDYSFDPAIATYVWQDGSTSAQYQINTTGVYSVTMTHYCGPSVDSVIVEALAIPSFDLGDTIRPCPGDTVILDAPNQSGNYTWQDGTGASTYEVTTSGTYALTVENVCGVDDGDVVVLYEQPLSPPDLGTDISLCPGEEAVLVATTPGASYLWQDMSTADTLSVDAAGTYHVTINNQCDSYADTIQITVEDMPPMITMADPVTLCQGSSVVLDPAISGVTYDWSDGTHQPTLTVTNPGTYSLTVTNACGSDIDTVRVIDGGSLPTVSLGPDVNTCTGEVINVNPVSSGVNTWLWHDGSMNANYITTAPGPVSVIVSNGCGVAYDTMLIVLEPLTPPLALGPDIDLCPGATVTLSIAQSNVSVTWSDGSVANDYVVTTSDTEVSAIITNGCGQSTDTVAVNVLPGVPPLDLGVDQSLCPGEVISFDPGITGVSYLWQDGSIASSYQTTQQVTVILTISNVCGMVSDTVAVTESTDGPHVDLGPDLIACEGEVLTIPSGISGVSYLWQDGSTGDEYVAVASGWVHLTVTNLCGTDIDSLLVDISGVVPSPDLGRDTMLCEGITIILASTADAFTTIAWQDGTTAPNFVVNTSGTYWLEETNRCGTARDSIRIDYSPLPQPFSLGPDTTICQGASFVILAPTTTDALRWQDGSSQPTIVADQAITYSLQISNACGTASDSLDVAINSDIPVVVLGNQQVWCPGEQIILEATQPFIATYLWSSGDDEARIVVTTPGIYSVEVMAPCATASGQVEVIEGDDCTSEDNIYIPNVFSPNDDQVNDLFIVFPGPDVQVTSMIGSIYDRWGNMVFSSAQIPFAWDGRFDNEPVMPGVYVYHLQIVYIIAGDEKEKLFTGEVTVVR